jgi:hypothetical protein
MVSNPLNLRRTYSKDLKEGFKEETAVFGRQVFKNTPEETLGRMVWVFQEMA